MSKPPILKYRAGAFDASVWENIRKKNGVEINFKTVTLTRSYKKKDEDIWRSEQMNIRRQDIPKIQALLRKVEDYLFFEVTKEAETGEGE